MNQVENSGTDGRTISNEPFRMTLPALALLLSGCVTTPAEENKYALYDCQRLLKAMEYKVNQANLLFTNYENEESLRKIGGGAVQAEVGSAMASSLILTPLGVLIAGGLMIGGTLNALDGLNHDELSDKEKANLRIYEMDFAEMRQKAIQKKCDYYAMPLWDISPGKRAR